MKIADNIKCKDFSFKNRPLGGQLQGQENIWVCDIYFKNQFVTTADNKTIAKQWVSQKVKQVNQVLKMARKQDLKGDNKK